MENPAIVIIACRRLEQVLNQISVLQSMPSFANYSLYVSLGCPEAISRKDLATRVSNLTILELNDPFVTQTSSTFLRIQLHYRFFLNQVFEHYNHSHVVLLEDDLELSPALLDYFEQTSVVLELDHSLICVSAFNDHAYIFIICFHIEVLKHLIQFVYDELVYFQT